jgi:branched-chain amino acid aminotransferase
MEPQVYIDGKFYQKSKATVSVFDHGLLYGDGIFEGIRVYEGNIFKLDAHLDRLYESAKTIMLAIPLTPAEMKEACIAAVKKNELRDAYIRLVVTRGVGDLGLDPRTCRRPTVIIIIDKIKLYPEALYTNGLEIATVTTTRNMADSLNPKIKSLNYLNNIMGKIEVNNMGLPEGLMLNASGYVAEATADNVFVVKNGVVRTPPTHDGALEGITRNTIVDICRSQGMVCEKKTLTRHDIYNADECFLSGTAAELIPVIKVDGRVVGSGHPGKVFERLRAEFRKVTRVEGTKAF